MDYSRSDLADALAADYVIGTMRGAARRRFEALLPAHVELGRATDAWQEALMPLTAAIDPVQPSGDVWRRISDRLERRKTVVADAWQRLSFWRSLTAFASVAAIGLAVLLAGPRPAAPPVVVVLAASAPASGAAAAPIVASISGDGKTLVTRSIAPVALRADRSLELWAVPKDGTAPRSLGVLPSGTGAATVALPGKVLADVDTLAVTVEPLGGSPTGKPTGPIAYAGKFTL